MWWYVVVCLLVGGWDTAHGDDECWDKLRLYTDYLVNRTNIPTWALQMFDSTNKFPEGILEGNQRNFGHFDECLMLQNIDTEAGVFDGKYCLVNLQLAIGRDMDLRRTVPVVFGWKFKQPHMHTFKGVNNSQNRVSQLQTTVGACVPSTCTADDAATFIEYLWKFLLNIEVDTSSTENDCQVAGNTVDPSGWGVILFLTVFVCLVVISTCYDLLVTEKEKKVRLLQSFSLYTNGKALFDTSTRVDSLGSIHGIRFISIAWIALGHHIAIATVNFINTVDFFETFPYDWTRLYFTNSFLGVDTFFMLSGLLVTYIFCKSVAKSNSFNLPMFYLHRYIRLTPALAILIMLAVILFPYVSNGPLWIYEKLQMTMFCPENWWKNILYVNNFVSPREICLGHTWFLSVDMQLYWCSPLLLVPLWKKPRHAVWLGVFYVIIGLFIPFAISYVHELGTSFVPMTLNADVQGSLDYELLYYNATHCKISGYVIGMLVGYFLYKVKTTSKKIHLTKVQVLGAWLLSFSLMLISLTCVHPMIQKEYQYNVLDASFYNALHKPAWSAGLGILIILCTIGYGGIINEFLSWSFFIPLSRLSYGIYLLHPLVQALVIDSVRSPQHSGDTNLMPQYFGCLVVTVFTSIIFSLLFEIPFVNLEKELLGKKESPLRKPNPTE